MTFTWRRGAAYQKILKWRKVREALRNPTEVLKNLMEKSKNETYRFQRLYRNLYNPEFYWLAYKNIYANDGSMTAGADGTTGTIHAGWTAPQRCRTCSHRRPAGGLLCRPVIARMHPMQSPPVKRRLWIWCRPGCELAYRQAKKNINNLGWQLDAAGRF